MPAGKMTIDQLRAWRDADAAQSIHRVSASIVRPRMARASDGSMALTQSRRYWPVCDWTGWARFGDLRIASPNPFRSESAE